ncbi:MAG: DUF1501 domain-containing protein, partial [Cyclobacteriaceae bacterium]|nr:DUF1501 domain-containing protein [Cyclobacteriaceae bacterium HetDA_MAG_MS6]
EGFEDEGVDPRGLPPAVLNGSPYEKEMDWILGLEDKSEVYIKRLQEVYENAPASTVTYPEIYPFGGNTRNPLTNQLQLVARLLHGGGPDQGVKTKVFLVKIGGFDTHAQQVESYDSTFGAHSSLVYHISSAMRAFQRDLATRGIEDRVLTMTMSEFGRRVGSNGSYGTDHGTGASVMLFGRNVNPGVYGNNPDMTLNNVAMQYDYRQLYATILRDWMEVDEATIANDIFFGDFLTDPNLVLTREVVLGKDPFIEKRYGLDSIYPNPAKDTAKLRYHVNDRQSVDFQLIDAQGKSVRQLGLYQADPGNHTIDLDLKDLTPGIYFVKVSSEKLNATQKLVIR